MSSTQAASNIERGASTSILPGRLTKASNTERVLPVPGSDVIKHLALLSIKLVVVTW